MPELDFSQLIVAFVARKGLINIIFCQLKLSAVFSFCSAVIFSSRHHLIVMFHFASLAASLCVQNSSCPMEKFVICDDFTVRLAFFVLGANFVIMHVLVAGFIIFIIIFLLLLFVFSNGQSSYANVTSNIYAPV